MIYFLIPVYNEEKNIPNLFEELKPYLNQEDIRIVFSDDGSKDDSTAVIRQHFPHAIILGNGKNHGPGFAFNCGFNWILSNSVHEDDIVVTLESDSTSDLQILPEMIAHIKMGADLVLASVYLPKGEIVNANRFRKFISIQANRWFRRFYRIKPKTLTSFYRVCSVRLLKNINQHFTTIISENGFISMLEFLLKASKLNAHIVEVPVTLNRGKRVDESKMKVVRTSLDYLKFIFKSYRMHKTGHGRQIT